MWEESPCCMLIRRLHLSMARQSNNVLRQHGLTMPQLLALLLLSDSPEKVLSLKELERQMQTSQPDVAGVAVRLAMKGLVERFVDENDRRVKRVHITEQGERYCAAARDEMRRAEAALLADMTGAEKESFRALLEKAARTLE